MGNVKNKMENIKIPSNSNQPSIDGSDDPSNVDSDTIIEIDSVPIKSINDFKKYYKSIKGAYHGEVSYESITLDLIAIYLKGQKLLYIESKTFCEQCLYHLMLPDIFISAVFTVISV
jgi:hypothetical protein